MNEQQPANRRRGECRNQMSESHLSVDRQRVDRLNGDIDFLLRGQPLPNPTEPGEYGEILQIAQILAHTDLSSQSRVRSTLKQRLFSQRPGPTSREAWFHKRSKGKHSMPTKTRLTLYALNAMLVLFLIAAATPTVRAFAQSVWQQVGPMIIVNKFASAPDQLILGGTPTAIPGAGAPVESLPDTSTTTLPGKDNGQEPVPAVNAKPTPVPVDTNSEPLTNQTAEERYGFKVLEPSYLPTGYQLIVDHQVNRFSSGDIISVYVYSTDSEAFDTPYLSIEQSRFPKELSFEFMVGDAEVSQVQVRGLTGTFIENAYLMTILDETGNNVTLPVDYLMWEEKDLVFIIKATQLNQQELLQIAESLQ